jgi:hypothetical protein
MVDDSPPVPQTTPGPPKDPGPTTGSNEWIQVQETKQRRRENGAGIAFSTGKSIKEFVLEIMFKEKADDETSGDLPNLNAIHRGFVSKLFEITNGDCHLLPSSNKPGPNGIIDKTKNPIISLNDFPKSDRDHRNFFQRKVIYDDKQRKTRVFLTHHVLMQESVKTVKEKLWNYLTEKRLWMRNGDLKSVETSSIGWLVGAHPALVFRPSIERELNRLVAALPLELREEMVALHGNPDEVDNLPPFFINQREHAFGFENDRVATSALTVSCVTDRARLMKELLSNVNRQDLSYMFIPLGMPTMEAQQAYKKLIVRNNDKINAVQGLSVKGFSDELFSKNMDPENNDSQTVQEYLFTHSAIQTIENTNLTEENGRFIFIVLKESFHEVREFVQDFCVKKFKTIYPTQEERDNYRIKYKSLPHLQMAPNAGGAVARLSAALVQFIDDEEKSTGIPIVANLSDTWAARVAPRFSFDQNSPHPNAKKHVNSAVVTPSTTTTAPPTVAVDNSSVNSGSTLANGTSGQTVVSQDLSSIVSQLQTQASDQSKMFQTMMEKQEKRDRRAARAQRKAAAMAQSFNEKLLTMMMSMMRDNNNNQNQQKKKKKSNTPKRSTPQERRARSPMWQASMDRIHNRANCEQEEEEQQEPEEMDITSADDELGSAASHYGDNGELGPFYDKEDEEYNGPYDGDDFGEAKNYAEDDDTSDDDDKSSATSDKESDDDESSGSSGSESDDDSSKTEEAGNRPTKENGLQNPKHEQKISTSNSRTPLPVTETAEIPRPPSSEEAVFTPTRARKPSGQSNMSKAEALAHSADKIAAKKREQVERNERKRLMGIPMDLTLNSDLTNNDPMLTTPPKSRSRQRSPGGTPTNDQKMQRTGTAPNKPSTQDELARSLDYSEAAHTSLPHETITTGTRRRRGKRE